MITLLTNYWLRVEAGALTPEGNTWRVIITPLQGQQDITITQRQIVDLIHKRFPNQVVTFDPLGWQPGFNDNAISHFTHFVTTAQPSIRVH